jgi:hypothetical protein
VKKASQERFDEIEWRLDLFLADPEVSEEKRAEVVSELLAMAFLEM